MVIAIIAILAAMLLPALSKARATARLSSCLNSLKNIGTAAQLYRDDYEDWMLAALQSGPKYWNGQIGNRAWSEFLGRYGDYSPCDYGVVLANKSFPKGVGCPDEAQIDKYDYATYATSGIVSGTVDNLTTYPFRKATTFTQPAMTIVYFDSGRFNNYTTNDPWAEGYSSVIIDGSPCTSTLTRHGGRTNISYLDGHVGTVKSKEFWENNGKQKLQYGVPGYESNWPLAY